jgi:hypothetical protein
MDAGPGRLDRIALIVDRRRRAGEIEYLFDLGIERRRDVMIDEAERRQAEQPPDIVRRPGVEVVDTKDVVAVRSGDRKDAPEKAAPPVTSVFIAQPAVGEVARIAPS